MGDQYLPMNSWAADELPREKLLTKGVAALWSWPGESSLIITTT